MKEQQWLQGMGEENQRRSSSKTQLSQQRSVLARLGKHVKSIQVKLDCCSEQCALVPPELNTQERQHWGGSWVFAATLNSYFIISAKCDSLPPHNSFTAPNALLS